MNRFWIRNPLKLIYHGRKISKTIVNKRTKITMKQEILTSKLGKPNIDGLENIIAIVNKRK